ncbi:MAG: DUF4124 domain-containing protein [Betaproteobacteria bacterium]
MCLSSAARTFALTIGTIALVFGSVADAAVYKCTSASGGVTYQDFPCDGGAVVDIRPGAPDPTAIERLDRANAEFDRRAAARSVDEANAALRREELDLRRRELDAAQGTAGTAPSVGYVPAYDYLGYGYGGYGYPGYRYPGYGYPGYGYPGYGYRGYGPAAPSAKHHANPSRPPKTSRGAPRVPQGRVPADMRRVQPR